MKAHILMITLLSTMIVSCASKRDIASTQNDQNYEATQQARRFEGSGPIIR